MNAYQSCLTVCTKVQKNRLTINVKILKQHFHEFWLAINKYQQNKCLENFLISSMNLFVKQKLKTLPKIYNK